MDRKSLQSGLEEYAANCAEIRRLSSARMMEGVDTDAYMAALYSDYERIGELGRRNREILSGGLRPLLAAKEHLPIDLITVLQKFCDMLLIPSTGEELDLMLLFEVSEKLLREFEFFGDTQALARQLNMHVSTCYSIVNMTSRLSGLEDIARKYRDSGLAAAEKAKAFVDDRERFLKLKNDGRISIIRVIRFYAALYDTAFWDDDTNRLRIEALDRAAAMYDDPFFRENVTGYDWELHLTRCCEHMGQLTERGNRWHISDSACRHIYDCAKTLTKLRDTYEKETEIIPEAHYSLIICRNAFFAGIMSKQTYRSRLLDIYDSFAGDDYDMYGVQINLLIPTEYLLTFAGEAVTAEECGKILSMYNRVNEYILNSVFNDAFNFMQEYLIGFMDAFIEIPGMMTYEEMALRSMAALHIPTYVHGVMSAFTASAIGAGLLRNHPELFADLESKEGSIMSFLNRAALFHDLGKLAVIDTITVYGRDLNEDEERVIRQHAEFGRMLLGKHSSTRVLAPFAMLHHGYFDDRGGHSEHSTDDHEHKILLDIIAAADSIAAATDPSTKCYRNTKSLDEIIAEIEDGADVRYAPVVAEVLRDEKVRRDLDFLAGEGRRSAYRSARMMLKRVVESARGHRDKVVRADLDAMLELLETEQKFVNAARLITNDEETVCPRDAKKEQGELAAFMETKAFEIRNSAEYTALLERLGGMRDELGEWEWAMVDYLTRKRFLEKNISPEQAYRFAVTAKNAYLAWEKAKKTSDYSLFRNDLAAVIGMCREKSRLRELREDEKLQMSCDYDIMLDAYERGITVKELDPLFENVAERLSDLLGRIRNSGRKIRTDFLSRPVPQYREKQAARRLLEILRFDGNRGTLAYTSHAYTERVGRNDTRITSYTLPGAFISNIYSVLHETGHALFEQLQPSKNFDYFLADGKTLGMHESVSRFYENMVGRSEEFISFIFPVLKEIYPEALYDVSAREFYEAVNYVEPTLIRTEADEVTYSMHIIIRYELEKRLVSGELSVDELPAAWNDYYEKYLGIRPGNDTEGVLQDVHWTEDFGYFPSYLLGNLYGAMFREVMDEEIGLGDALRRGDFALINGWMRDNVFARADRYAPKEWIRDITGRDLNADAFMDYLENKYSDIYGLSGKKDDRNRRFDGYARRMQRIRLLSSPQLDSMTTADAYRSTLAANFMNIGELAGENRHVMKDLIMPILNNNEPLDEATIRQIKRLNENLMDAWAHDNTDLPVMAMLSERLMNDAYGKEDDDYLVEQLDQEIIACIAMIVQTRRIITDPDITRKVRKRGVEALDRLLQFLDRDRFTAISEASRELVLINSRYGDGLYVTMSPLTAEERGRRFDMLKKALELAEDPFYREAAPDYDWDYHIYRCYQYISSYDEFDNAAGCSDEELQIVADYGEKLEELWLSDSERFGEYDVFSYIHAHTMRNRMHAGRVTKEEYRRVLLELYEKRDTDKYDVDTITDNIELPKEYASALDIGEMSAEEAVALGRMYEAALSYVFVMPKLGVFYELMDYYAPMIFNFIEVPGGMTFEEMGLKTFAAFHPPTYIHSMMVADISRCLASHLLRKEPQLFDGIPVSDSFDSEEARRAYIESFVYHCALCHDFGKLIIIDTIFVYGRKILDFEFDIIKQHPALGAELMQRHESTFRYADVAMGHHVWYDGSNGYPVEFDVKNSPLKTVIDIVECADCMDAATDSVGRSYRPGKTPAGFFKELKEGAGTRYAPYLAALIDDEAVMKDLLYILSEGRQNRYRSAYLLLKEVRSDNR